jgi:hypothetical protein
VSEAPGEGSSKSRPTTDKGSLKFSGRLFFVASEQLKKLGELFANAKPLEEIKSGKALKKFIVICGSQECERPAFKRR